MTLQVFVDVRLVPRRQRQVHDKSTPAVNHYGTLVGCQSFDTHSSSVCTHLRICLRVYKYLYTCVYIYMYQCKHMYGI